MHTSLAHQVHRIMMAQFTITPTVHHRERLATLLQHPRDVLLDATPRRAAFPRATVAMLAPFERPRWPPDCCCGWSCLAGAPRVSTWAIRTGYDARRLTLSRAQRRQHRPGTVLPARDDKHRSQPEVAWPDCVTMTGAPLLKTTSSASHT